MKAKYAGLLTSIYKLIEEDSISNNIKEYILYKYIFPRIAQAILGGRENIIIKGNMREDVRTHLIELGYNIHHIYNPKLPNADAEIHISWQHEIKKQ